MPNTDASLQTTIRNISGSGRFFGYIPPHGKFLNDDQTYTFDGNIFTLLAGIRNKRKFTALLKDLGVTVNGVTLTPAVSILQTPGAILYDATLHTSKLLGIANGAVVLVDPSWAAESSGVS
jgi:hypothetical protein